MTRTDPTPAQYDRAMSEWGKERMRAARLQEEVQKLRDQVETMGQVQDLPLWRRVSNQRREIRAAWAYANMYRRWWQAEQEKNRGTD